MRGLWHGIVDFVVGDDIWIAIAVLVLLAVAAAAVHFGADAWWLLAVGVPAALWVSLQRAQRVAEGDAESFIAGYTCVNDVTCRDLQKTDGQWTRAKGFDTFCPVGPSVVALDWRTLSIVTRVNGAERQRGMSSDMIFSIPRLVAHVSAIMTLEPGDLIATGTPAGVGKLAPGDVVEVEIPGIGLLSNHVAAQESS